MSKIDGFYKAEVAQLQQGNSVAVDSPVVQVFNKSMPVTQEEATNLKNEYGHSTKELKMKVAGEIFEKNAVSLVWSDDRVQNKCHLTR